MPITPLPPIELVSVGDPGNPPDISTNGALSGSKNCGSVATSFHIGKYDITAIQMCAFFNAVAKSDQYQLYDSRMSDDPNVASIMRSGTPGHYIYNVISDKTAQLPIVYVSWFTAARFCNWLHNNQPTTGNEDATTTEKGAYDLAALVTIKNQQKYCNFLNAVAKTDLRRLYEPTVALIIKRQGVPGSYSYSLNKLKTKQPALLQVSYFSAARFLNWEYNTSSNASNKVSQASEDALTENGIYELAREMRDIIGNADVASTDYCSIAPGAKFYLPSEDQYYKAAFYKRNIDANNQLTAEYWTYPTKSDKVPNNVIGDNNSVNYYVATNKNNAQAGFFTFNRHNYRFTNLGIAPYLTPVGAFYNVPGPYGTFDMGGDVSQWLNGSTAEAPSIRRIRGGGWGVKNQWPIGPDQLSKDTGSKEVDSSLKENYIGFRIAAP